MTDDIMRMVVTVDQLRECSEKFGRDMPMEEVRLAQDQMMTYITGCLTPEEHMRLTVDLICMLKKRDPEKYVGMLQAVAIHQLESMVADYLEGGDDGSLEAAQDGHEKAEDIQRV